MVVSLTKTEQEFLHKLVYMQIKNVSFSNTHGSFTYSALNDLKNKLKSEEKK